MAHSLKPSDSNRCLIPAGSLAHDWHHRPRPCLADQLFTEGYHSVLVQAAGALFKGHSTSTLP